MLSLPVELSLLPSTSKLSQRSLRRTLHLGQSLPLQQSLARIRPATGNSNTNRTCSFCSKASSATSSIPTAFAYLSKRRQRPVISIAMSTMSRRKITTPPPAPKSPARSSHDHDHDHSHSHSHGHSHDGHDHGHSHGGIFHSHAHDHSEGADQIMQALSKGKLDRGTRITLLGESASLLVDKRSVLGALD